MKRTLLGFCVSLVTLAVGVLISPVRFSEDLVACGYVPDGGGSASVTRFTSTYFEKLWFSHETYPGAEKSREVFGERLAGAVRVLERTPKYDRGGRTVGERAVAVFPGKESGGQYFGALWTDGNTLHSIHSTSLSHVLQFERDHTN